MTADTTNDSVPKAASDANHTAPNTLAKPTKDTLPQDYEGHSKDEVTRLITQALYDLGYSDVAKQLETQSGLAIEVPLVASFRKAVLNGEWDEAENLLKSLDLQPSSDLQYLSFLIHRQQYLELLEKQDTKNALRILRTKISTLPYDSNTLGFEEAEKRRQEIHTLTNVLMFSPEDIRSALDWDGAAGQSRNVLLSFLQELISADMMIPRHRLAKLLSQAKQFQLSRANYRIDNTPFSLCKDFPDDRQKFPLKVTHVLNRHTTEVWYISFSHNGKYLASASLDSTVLIWKVDDNFSFQRMLQAHEKGVVCVEWSPDDTKLLSAGRDRAAILWDVETGERLLTLDKHNDIVSSCAWLPDGQHFITSSPDQNIYMWDLNGNVVYKWSGIRVLSMAVTPDGKKMVALCSEKSLHVFDLQTREKIKEFKIDLPLLSVSVSKDSRYALINTQPEEIQLWDLERYQVVRKYICEAPATDVMRSCFGGPDENIVMSSSQSNNIYVWNRETTRLLEVLDGHVGTVNCVKFNPVNLAMFASCGDDGLIKIWQPQNVATNGSD
ncbi:hypothetical protein DV454_000169 [Geotrichum candidum]|nr:hypothetical protein DV454_000169 [Geotrichum candidum]